MQLSTLATAPLAQIKSFARKNNILPTGDLRRRATWESAVQSFLSAAVEVAQETVEGAIECIREVATYDNAVIAANAVHTWTRGSIKFTAKAAWTFILVAIALACIAVDLWQNQAETKDVLVSVYRRFAIRIRDRWVIWREMGDAAFQLHVTEKINVRVVQPILDHRARIRSMARAAIH